MDIGIETHPKYRHRGFAALTAAKTVGYALQHNLTPEWGCDAENLGSAATSKSIGFIKGYTYYIYTKKIIHLFYKNILVINTKPIIIIKFIYPK